MVIEVDRTVVGGNPIVMVIDAFRNREETVEVDLSRVRIVRNWGDREVCFLSASGEPGGLGVVPGGVTKQKEVMERFLRGWRMLPDKPSSRKT